MNNENSPCSGHACPYTSHEDVLGNFPDFGEYQYLPLSEDWLKDVDLILDGTVASDEAQFITVVGPSLGSENKGLQYPPSITALDRQPPPGAASVGSPCDCVVQDVLCGGNFYTQQDPGFPLLDDNITFDIVDSNSVPDQNAVPYNSPSPSFIASPKTPPAASAHVLEKPILDCPAKSQRKVHRCELPNTEVQSPTEQITCGQTFDRLKDLKRHESSVHRQDDDPVYLCRCGKDDPRKDNHLRHIKTCANSTLLRSYVCKCGHRSEERDDHRGHVRRCSHGFGPRGRPRSRRLRLEFRARVACSSMGSFDVVSEAPLLRQSALMQ